MAARFAVDLADRLCIFPSLCLCTLMIHLSVENVGRILSKAFVQRL